MRKKRRGAVNSKKSVYNGITFQSKLELYCYKKLKEAGIDFQYEENTYEIFPGFKHKGRYGKKASRGFGIKENRVIRAVTYTPDFVSDTHKFIIETKGYVPSQHSFPLRFKMFLHYCQQNGMSDYAIYIPSNQAQVDQVVQDIVNNS